MWQIIVVLLLIRKYFFFVNIFLRNLLFICNVPIYSISLQQELTNHKKSTSKTLYFELNKVNNFSIIQKHSNQNCDLPIFFGKSSGTFNIIDGHDEGKRLQKYAELLMPLMFETWMEVRPANYGQEFSGDLVISFEAAFSLQKILDIMEKIYKLITMWDDEVNNEDLSNWFKAQYSKEFSNQFCSSFPFIQNAGFKGIQ